MLVGYGKCGYVVIAVRGENPQNTNLGKKSSSLKMLAQKP